MLSDQWIRLLLVKHESRVIKEPFHVLLITNKYAKYISSISHPRPVSIFRPRIFLLSELGRNLLKEMLID